MRGYSLTQYVVMNLVCFTNYRQVTCTIFIFSLHFYLQSLLELSLCLSIEMSVGDPGAISKVPGEVDIRYLDDSVRKDGLQHLNLL